MDTLMSLQMSDPIAQHLGSWSQEINVLSICLRIALAVFLTSVIGCERSSKRHSAGLRTFVQISFSSTICMILDIYLMQTQAIDIPILSAATMISAASISGKSILFSSRGQIKGLTTSAALWSCAALGFTIGAGLYTVNVEGLLQSSIQEQRPKARLDMHSIEAALSDDASFPDGKIEPGFLDRYANRIVKSNNRYIWMLQLMNVQQIMPIQSERQPIAMVTYKSGVPYDIEQEQIGKQDKESARPDCATICRPQDFFLNMGRTKRKRKLVEWLESCQKNQVSVLDEKIPLLSFAVDFVTAYEYQKARGIKIHPGLWENMRVDIFLVKKEN